MKISDKNYRMSKPLKVMLANILDKQRRNDIKRAMIEAEVSSLRFRNRRSSGDRNDSQSDQ